MVYGLVAAVLAALLGYALWEPYWIEATEHTVAIPDLPEVFDGFTILHLSDMHGRVGVFSWARFREWQRDADMIAVTGDLYSPSLSRARLAQHLESLTAKDGVFYISGNHDYRRGTLAVEPWNPGDRRIDNRIVAVRRGDEQILLAGLPDFVKGNPDWATVRDKLEQCRGIAILLVHRPDAWLLPGVERVSLILAGHTHGGQVVIPGMGAPVRHNRVPDGYVAGRREAPGRPVLITSRGLGTSELPIRFGARPEVIRVRLVRAQHEVR